MATYVVTDPGSGNDIYPNFLAAVNNCAASGDTVIVPSVMRPFTDQVTTTKKFNVCTVIPATVIWNGFASDYSIESNALTIVNSAIWYRPESMSDSTLNTGGGGGTPMAFIKFNDPEVSPQTSLTTDGVRVSDIEFRSKIPSIDGYPANGGSTTAPDGLSLASDYALVFNKSVDFHVTRCTFKYFGYAAIEYKHWDSVSRGLIYKCHFEQNAKGSDGLGLGYGVVVYGENLTWSTNPEFGSNNFLFVENCTFNLNRHAISGGGNGMYVIRYCYIQDNIVTYFRSCQAIDAHGRRGGSVGNSNYYSTHTVEAYNNKIVNQYRYDGTHTGLRVPIGSTTDEDDLISDGLRLKECFHLSYNNIVKGYRFGHGIQIETINIYANGNTGYPQQNTFGQPSAITGGSSNPNGDLGDSYIWNNDVHLLNGNCEDLHNYTPSIFVSGRDYHLTAYGYANADSAGTGSAYAYPHPLRDDIVIPVGTARRLYRSRTYHAGK
jgi:hypothetical protein